MAAGSALLLVSCEPIPYNPDYYGPRPQPPRDGPRTPGSEEPPYGQPPTRDDYPVAERTANPNHVISPYAPYNVINVEGFRSGQLAKDPSNGKIFRIP